MAKMKERNAQLKSALGAMAPKERIVEANNLPQYDAKNRQGVCAYAVADELRLIAMLNTLKLEPQAYRTENETMKELRDLIEKIGMKDPYFVAQAIAWSRNQGEGMRSINHLAAALLAPFASGEEWAKRFYSLYNKTTKSGGCIYRPDDMQEIKDVYAALNQGTLSNAMRKGFADAIEHLDTYLLAKYKDAVINVANLSHPKSKLSTAEIMVNGKKMKTLDALMQGITVSADTWEVAQAEAGQEVAKAVKAGVLDAKEAEAVLAEAKNNNWEDLLKEGKLGILAALRNIRNMLKNPRHEVIAMLAALLSNGELIRKGKIMPYQIDTAYEIVKEEFSGAYAETIKAALIKGYELSVPNLAEALPGKTCVFLDCSGSMWTGCMNGRSRMSATACEKAGLIAATIAKATGADVVRFGSNAQMASYNPQKNVFELGKELANSNMGCTSISAAFELIRQRRLKYDRIIILSDNECNRGTTYGSYKSYIHDVCSPYIYAVDLAVYGTTPVKNEGKVNYYFGFGYTFFDDIASREFNPAAHIAKVRKYVI